MKKEAEILIVQRIPAFLLRLSGFAADFAVQWKQIYRERRKKL